MVEVDAEHAGQRLDNYLLRLCKGVPKTHIYKAIRGGEVRVNKGRIQADYRVAEGDIVRIPPLRLPDPGAPKPVPAAEFPVVYEDDAMLVVDKPAGVAVHGGSGVSFGVIEQLRAARPQAKFLNWSTGWIAKRPACSWSPRSATRCWPCTPCCARARARSTTWRWWRATGSTTASTSS